MSPCPCCGGSLKVIGSRVRVRYRNTGEKEKLIIRRLVCKKCGVIHHELPNILIPYRRYDAESIEAVVSDPVHCDVAVDQSTIYRWNHWMLQWYTYAIGCLQSISLRFHLPVEEMSTSSQSILHLLGRFVGEAKGWLSRVVQPITNSNLWVTYPF